MFCLMLFRDMTEDDVAVISSNGQLTLTLVSRDHEGEWRCQATNSSGSTEATTRLIVTPGKGMYIHWLFSNFIMCINFLIQLNHCLHHDLIANTNLFQFMILEHTSPCYTRVVTKGLKLNMRLTNPISLCNNFVFKCYSLSSMARGCPLL